MRSAAIREESDGWMFLVDGERQGVIKAWNVDEAKEEAARRIGITVEWEPRGDLEYVAVMIEDGPILP
jgi:hypothetical protein